jgi:hypothetical protein
MMAQAVAKASGFFKTFMTDGWLGKTATAGKALARAIGIILVELIFILLFDSAALFKVLKTAAKSGVKGVANLAKAGVKSTLKAGKNAFVATGKGFVKQAGKAKFFVQGIGKGFAKGAKNLDELGENLAKRFKFKGFSLELKGRWFTLYGIINPKVPLAKGQTNLPKDSYKKVTSNARANKALKLMDEVTGGHTHGRHSATKADKWLFDRAFDRIPNARIHTAKASTKFLDPNIHMKTIKMLEKKLEMVLSVLMKD